MNFLQWYGSTKKRPFISVYPGRYGTYVASYTKEQRREREGRIFRNCNMDRPAYRINIKFKDSKP